MHHIEITNRRIGYTTSRLVWRAKVIIYQYYKLNKMLSYCRDRAEGCVIVFAKSRRLELGDNILQIL